MTLDFFREMTKDLPGDVDLLIEVGKEKIEPIDNQARHMVLRLNPNAEEKNVLILKPLDGDVKDVIEKGLNLN